VTLENWRLMVQSIQPFFHLLITKKMSFLTKVTRLVAGLSCLYSLTIGEQTKCDVLWHRGIIMTENLIKNAMHAIETMDHSREATLRRLQRAGILTKTGRMTAFYRRCIQAQTPKG
jgi:hypothetical protein